jgi:hypothetical protein
MLKRCKEEWTPGRKRVIRSSPEPFENGGENACLVLNIAPE